MQNRTPGFSRTFLNQCLVLLCLTGFAITEPVLGIFGANPGLFYFYNVSAVSLLVVYALTIAIVPALLLQAVTAIAGLFHRGVASALHVCFVGLLAGLWLVQLAKWSFGVGSPSLLVALLLLGAAAFALLYVKWPLLNSWLKIAAIAPVIAVGSFLVFSDAGNAMRKSDLEIVQRETDAPLPSVVFVLLDEFPTLGVLDERGLIDEIRFPNLAALAAQSTWYRHYSVLSGRTDFSVPSILTGGDPIAATASIENYPNNLFSLLAPTHFLTAYETLTQLCGLPQCSEGPPGSSVQKPAPQLRAIFAKTVSLWVSRVALTQQGDSRLDDFEEELADSEPLDQKTKDAFFRHFLGAQGMQSTQKKPARLQRFTEAFVKSERPALYFLHLELPHLPWRFSDKGELYDLPRDRVPMSPENDDGGEWLAQLSEYRFLLQAQYTDSLLGDIQRRLQAQGIWEDALVVVTADHGRSFRLNTRGRILGPDTYESIAYVPLMIKRPKQQDGRIDDSNMMAYDLLPTVAAEVGIDVPWKTPGFAAGDPGIAARGDEKVCFPAEERRSRGAAKVGGAIVGQQTFSDKEHFPKFSSRWIGARERGDDALALLNQRLELKSYLGRAVAEFDVLPGGRAVVDELARLRRPAADETPPGIVMGNIEFESGADEVLVAVNGRLVTGSPLVDFKGVSDTFVAMLPFGVLQRENDIGVYLVDGERLLALAIH